MISDKYYFLFITIFDDMKLQNRVHHVLPKDVQWLCAGFFSAIAISTSMPNVCVTKTTH